MMSPPKNKSFQDLVRQELRHLTAMNPSERRWQLPLFAALASGLPLLVGAYFNHLDYGLVSSLGGLVFLYAPNTPLSHRMVFLMACAFGLCACYTLGVMTHFLPFLLVVVLSGLTMLVTMVCRFYALGPPGSLFFIMAAAIGAYAPIEVLQVPLFVGLMTMGCLQACLLAFFYAVYSLRKQAAQPVKPLPKASFDFVILDSVVTAVFVGIALVIAQTLHLERAYWVPISCLAVMQGASLRAVWNKQVHRIAGTGLGLLLSWGVLSLPLDRWTVSFVMIALAFVIEILVVRHYGLAMVFITPLTLLLAEATHLGQGAPGLLIQARFFDTVLGSVVGLFGGICLHNPRFRKVLGQLLLRLAPARWTP